MAFRSRLVSCVVIGDRFHMQEENGTRIPLNREGYGSIANAIKGLERYYEIKTTEFDCEYRLVRVRDSHKRIAPRDLVFVDRMIDHELNEEEKANRLEKIRRDADAVAPALDFEAPAFAEVLPVPMTDPVVAHVVAALPPRPASPRTWYADLNPMRGQRGEKPWRVFWRDADGAHMSGIRGSRRKCERWAASANINQPSFGCRESYETPRAANVEAPTVLHLDHGQAVRLPLWNHMTYAKVGSVEGYARENGDDVQATLDRAKQHGHEIAYAYYTGGALVNDGGAYYARQQAIVAGAVTLDVGTVVEIEGRRYRAKVRPESLKHPRYSDPIKFEPA